ncbi:MAG: dipeptidase [Alphaproteobacteria bacterium]
MNRLIDLHAHPSLKMYYLPYLRATFHAATYTGKHWNPFGFRYQYGNLRRSPTKVLFCTHYVVEKGFLTKGIHPHSRAFLWAAWPYWYGKMRREDPWQALGGMMDKIEKSVPNTNRWVRGDGPRLKMVRNYAEVETLADNEIGLVHAIEGAHVFGYEPEDGQSLDDFWQRTRQRLDQLQARGVAMIGLAHFWDNMFVPQTDGTEAIPKVKNGQVVVGRDDLLFKMQRADWRWDDENKLGETLVRELLERGILLDLTHVQEHAREAIYDLCKEYKRPPILSHVGLKHFHDHEYNLSDDEVRRIHRLGGVIGLILSKRLLVDPLKRHGDNGEGIRDLIENMVYVRDLIGDVSSLGIGTDFDGLTHPFTDCHTPGELPRLIEAMKEFFSEEEIDDILYGNSQRAMKRGWGRPQIKKQAG